MAAPEASVHPVRNRPCYQKCFKKANVATEADDVMISFVYNKLVIYLYP